MDDYTSIGYHKPSQILGELSLNYGKMNFNVAAFKTGDELKDRSSFDPNAKFENIHTQERKKALPIHFQRLMLTLNILLTIHTKTVSIKTKYSINISLTAMLRTRGVPILIRRTIFGRKIYLYNRTCLL